MKLELHIPLTNHRIDLDAEPVLQELSASSIAVLLTTSAMGDGVEPGRVFGQIERLANDVNSTVEDYLCDYRDERRRLNRRLNDQSGHGLDGDELATWHISLSALSSCEDWLITHRPDAIKVVLKKADEMGLDDEFQTLRAFTAAAAASKAIERTRLMNRKVTRLG